MQSRRVSWLSVAAFVAALVMGTVVPALAAGTVKIGFLGALTGNVAIYGINTLAGMKMAADEINAAGGVLGNKVVVVEEDDRGDKTEIANIMQKYVSRDKVAAVVGDPTTGGTKVAAPIAQSAKIVLLSAGATGPGVVEIGDYIFRNTLLDTVAAPATVKYVVGKYGHKRIALVTSVNNDYSVGLSRIFEEGIKAAGASIVIRESISDGDTDFSAQITKIKVAKPDLIVFSGYYTEGALMMKEARKQGLNVVMVGGDGLQSPVLMKLGGKAVEGSVTYAGFSPEGASGRTKKLLDAYKAKYNKEADLFVAQGYDAVYLLAEAMKRAGSVDPKVFRAELARTKGYPGVSGKTTFRENREPVKSPIYLLVVKNGDFSLLDTVDVD